MRRNNLVGQMFGRLTVVRVAGVNTKQNVLWECRCSCGSTTKALAYDLRNGRVVSCGCYVREGQNLRHGYARGGQRRSRVYSVWSAMLARCGNPRDRNYANYGGRGIKVCKRWMKFENFLADMGEPAPGFSLERRNNDRGYTPRNTYWATRIEQARNKRTTVWIKLPEGRFVLKDALARIGYSMAAHHYQKKQHGLSAQEVIDKWLAQKKAR